MLNVNSTVMQKLRPTIMFPKAIINNGKLIFETNNGYAEALKYGVFFVKIPSSIDVQPGINFCENFYKDKTNNVYDSYQGFKGLSYSDSILGYSDRPDQVEQIQLELLLWDKYFPTPLAQLLKQMNNVGLTIVEDIFRQLNIAEQFWHEITGGASEGTGLQYCIFNHYRTCKQNIGINTHKDSGFITVLYSPEPGLEALIDGQWFPINPEAGYFTINLGHSFEILTAKLPAPITAVDHCVKQVVKPLHEADRYSFGTYLGPRFDMNLYHYNDNKLEFHQSFLEFQKIKAKAMGYEFHPRVKG